MVALALLACVPFVLAPSGAQEGQATDQLDPALARRVTALLVERCAGCHTAESDDPRAVKRWDGARDLRRSVLDPDILVPGDPDDSPMYYEIEDGNMPPLDSEVPAYTDLELAELRSWIKAGAPIPEALADDPALENGGPAPIEPHAGPSSWTQLYARGHVSIVHFPIALLIVAFVAELLRQRSTARFCLWLGALAASFASLSGWIHAGGFGEEAIDAHRWAGIATTAVAWLAVVSAELRARGSTRAFARINPVFVLACAVLVALTGHWGGQLVWGNDYLSLP